MSLDKGTADADVVSLRENQMQHSLKKKKNVNFVVVGFSENGSMTLEFMKSLLSL